MYVANYVHWRSYMDITVLIGLIGGTAMLLLGQALEGGNVGQLLQVTAAMIVFGGTLGAVIISFPAEVLVSSIKHLKDVFFSVKVDYDELIQEIIGYAQKARKDGIISLEKDAADASDSLLALGLGIIADGADPSLVKAMLETQLGQFEEEIHSAAKVYESAGGYSPTFGIIGAVMGLIQVMQNLSDPSALGAGIAVAFVATIYGLFAANLLLIPCGTKLKFKFAGVIKAKEMIIEGLLSIQAGESPALIERKLYAYVLDHKEDGGKE